MKKLMVAVVGACASLVSFGFDWTGKTGVVTLTETAEVTDDDIETVAALDGILLEGETTDIVFKNTQPIALSGYIKGGGTIVKSGTGDVTFGEPALNSTEKINSGNRCFDYFTTGGVRVVTGTLYASQTSTRFFWYGPIVVEADATLFTSPVNSCGVESLNGAGNITNTSPRVSYNYTPVVASKWDNGCNIIIGRYGSENYSLFTGRIDGFIGLQICSEVHLTNPNSTFYGDISIDIPYYTNAKTKSGQFHFNEFGKKGKGNASSGGGDFYLYGMEFALNYGGKLFYHGEGGETTDKRFRWCMTYDYGAGFETLDAGHKGGVTFTGEWSNNTADRMNGIILTGSNTTDMVLANKLSCAYGDGTKTFWSLKKTGTGSWRLADHADRNAYFAGWFVEEGTLKYDSIADIGETCALGLSTECFPFQKATAYATARAEENRLPYEIQLGGGATEAILEYSGSGDCVSNDRRIGLAGTGGTLAASADAGSVELLGGIKSVDGAAKTLTLAGANAKPSMIGNLANDGNAVLSVAKKGSGEWQLTHDVRLTGDVSVKEGTLTIAPVHKPVNYKWYRLVLTKFGTVHTNLVESGLEDMTECTGSSYYPRLRGIALYTADGTPYTPTMEDYVPWDNMDEDQKTGGKSYKYPADWWRGMEPGQVTIGEFKGNEYRTYPANMPSRLFLNMQKATASEHVVYNSYIGSTPTPTNPNAWLPIVFRLPDDAPAIAYYDILADHSSQATAGHVATWYMEGSEDGTSWTKLHEITSCAHTKQGCWASTGTNALKWAANANCLTEERGYALSQTKDPEPVQYETDFSTVSSLSVSRGATLKRLEGSYAVELPKLTVDCAGEGVATVKGFKIAETGVLTLANAPKGEVKLPVAFIDCEDLENLENWTAVVAGKAKPRYSIEVSGGDVTLKPFGMAILVR